ncbi:MAG: hypothetical protein EOM12_13615 [Verrucomicrobiae bacterium]|nr:hypothetical protein [Verrucomicrobiae bacterium]
MPSSKTEQFLLDSNTYYRLALNLHPLLSKSFSKNPAHRLCVIKETEQEWSRNPRLKNKFEWLREDKYVEDRRNSTLKISKSDRERIENVYSYICGFEDLLKGVNISRVDMIVLATGYIKKIVVISDDGGLQQVGEMAEIKVWSTLQLLKLMFTNKRINQHDIESLIEYWNYENDLPTRNVSLFRKQFNDLFDFKCPV